MNVNSLRRLDIVIKKSHILRPNADFKYVPQSSNDLHRLNLPAVPFYGIQNHNYTPRKLCL